MTDTTEARRDALRQVVADNGGFAKVVEKFRLTQAHASYLSQLTAKESVAAFGERSAGNWEKRLKLPDGVLVNAGRSDASRTQLGPLSRELMVALAALDAEGRRKAENVLRSHLDLPPLPRVENEKAA